MNDRTSWSAALIIAAAFFVASAPTLAWLEFSSTMENLAVATALEIRRDGCWLLPTLEHEPRIAKPPLAAWIAAASIRNSTFHHLDDPDPARRAEAYDALALDVRWTALLASCLMLLAVFDLGKTIADAPTGLIAMIVAGSTLFFLRFGRSATTDIQLTLWVTIANAALARLLLRGPSWRGATVVGIALGLALMSKGPVALLQTLPPAIVFILWLRPRFSRAQAALMILLMLLIGGAWYGYVFAAVPNVWPRWKVELFRTAPSEHSSHPLSYFILLGDLLPWTPLFLHGLIWTAVAAWQNRRLRRPDGMTFALLLIIVPIAVMTCFPDRKDRYLLPLLGPCAILTARAVGAMLDATDRRRLPPWVHWTAVGILGIGLPIAGAMSRVVGSAWYSPRFAACCAIFMTMVLVIAMLQSRQHPIAMVIGPAVIMLMLLPIFLLGYRQTREGRAEMRPLAELIRSIAPDALMYNWRPDAPKRADVSLSIYLNRPTVWIADAAALKPAEHPQVIITQQRRDLPPVLPAAGFSFIGAVPHDKDEFRAFLRPANFAAASPPP